jgi:putative MATE family efflux protein
MHAANVFLNWLLIFGNLGAPALGVQGAGAASACSVFIGTACYVFMASRHARGAGFLRGIPGADTMRTMVRISFPAGMQTFFFAAGMTVLFWIVGQIGTAELAASHVLITVMLVTILPAIGFGLAAATLVGQALGSKDRAEAMVMGWAVVRVAMTVVGIVALIEIVVPDLILGVFLHDPATLELARWPLRVVGLATVFDAAGLVLLNAHLGAGYSRWVMKVSIGLQWGVFLPSAYLLGPVLGQGLLAVWIANAGFRALQAAVMASSWKKGRWAYVRL